MNKVVLGSLLAVGLGSASAPADAIYCDTCGNSQSYTACFTTTVYNVNGQALFSERYCSSFSSPDPYSRVPEDFPDFWDRQFAGGAGGWVFVQKNVIPRMLKNEFATTCGAPLTDRWMHADREVTLHRATGAQVAGGVPVKISYVGGGTEIWISGPAGSSVGVTGEPVPGTRVCPQ